MFPCRCGLPTVPCARLRARTGQCRRWRSHFARLRPPAPAKSLLGAPNRYLSHIWSQHCGRLRVGFCRLREVVLLFLFAVSVMVLPSPIGMLARLAGRKPTQRRVCQASIGAKIGGRSITLAAQVELLLFLLHLAPLRLCLLNNLLLQLHRHNVVMVHFHIE